MKLALNNKNQLTAGLFLALGITACGLFYELFSAAASVGLAAVLIFTAIKKGGLRLRLSPLSLAVGAILLFYIITPLWAADGGMAPFGIVKFLPVPLFLLLLMQYDRATLKGLSELLPPVAAFMTVVSAVLMQFSGTAPYFSVNGRLAGFLQYPNTFALICLCGLIITLLRPKLALTELLLGLILAFGILYSGSRTVFVLTLAALLLIVFKKIQSVKKRLIAVAVIIGGVAVLCLIALLFGLTQSIGRFLTLSVFESTFLGRFLYFWDALPVILKNPFGTGYLGYYAVEQSIQSGLYSVRFIHNDFIQLLLDVGWLPTAALIFAVVRRLFSKGCDFKHRLLIIIMTLHSCFDFNLQFTAVFMLYIALLYDGSGRCVKLSNPAMAVVPLGIFAALSVYFGVAQGLYYAGSPAAACGLYPNFTEAKQVLLTTEQDGKKMNQLADEILALNPSSSLAHSAKANYYFSSGDLRGALNQMDMAMELAPFAYAEYEKTAYMLTSAIKLYAEAGDAASLTYCTEKLIALSDRLHALPQKLSTLGAMIDDQPTTELPQELEDYIEVIKNNGK